MTDGIIQKVCRKWLWDNSMLEQELIEEVKICMVSLYEQNPLFHANALKVIQRELIGDNEK
jgi:hypothetical protein